jgi:glycerate 2-kinase
MKIVIAPDSFKGSLSAIDTAKALEKGIKNVFPYAETILIPMADGGDGTLDTLVVATEGKREPVVVKGPLGNEVEAEYGILGDNKTCVIEIAIASGLCLVEHDSLNPLITTTYGTGQLIKKALDNGYRKFIIALGGSATNDGGAGMLQALGVKLLDRKGKEVSYGGGELGKIHTIEMENFDKRIFESEFIIASDVQNPLIGLNGASHVFGPQKGATKQMVQVLDDNMGHWANLVEKVTGKHIHDLTGAGAAGGMGGAFLAFFPSRMQRGVDVVIEHVKLNDALLDADLVLTGEGQVDFQTASGKTPMGVAQVAKSKNIPTIIVAGSVGPGIESLYEYGVISINSIINRPMTLKEAMVQATDLLEQCAEQVVRTYFYNELTEIKKVKA